MTDWNQPPGPPPGPPPGAPPGAPPQGQYPPMGQPQGHYDPNMPPQMYQTASPSNGSAIAGMVLGIVGIVFFWIPIGDIILNGLAILLSSSGMGKARTMGGYGKGMAIAGLVCGIIGMLLSLYFTVGFFIALDAADSYNSF